MSGYARAGGIGRMHVWHLTWSTASRHPIAAQESDRRALVRLLGRVAGDSIALFCIADDHLHVVLFCTEPARGRIAQALSLALAAACSESLCPAHTRRVEERSHLAWLANHYILGQPIKHGLASHPALWSGSCFPDLVGARVIPGLRLRVFDALPRWRLGDAFVAVGLPRVPLTPVEDALARRLGASRAVASVASACAGDAGLRGRGDCETLGRRAVAQICSAATISTGEMAFALGITPQAANRLVRRAADAGASPGAEGLAARCAERRYRRPEGAGPDLDRLVAAARLHLALEQVVAGLPATAREPDPPAYTPFGRSGSESPENPGARVTAHPAFEVRPENPGAGVTAHPALEVRPGNPGARVTAHPALEVRRCARQCLSPAHLATRATGRSRGGGIM